MRKQAGMIKEEDEKKLIALGILGQHSPQALLHTLLFECGKLFGLRGGKELRNVRRSHFEFTNVGPFN